MFTGLVAAFDKCFMFLGSRVCLFIPLFYIYFGRPSVHQTWVAKDIQWSRNGLQSSGQETNKHIDNEEEKHRKP